MLACQISLPFWHGSYYRLQSHKFEVREFMSFTASLYTVYFNWKRKRWWRLKYQKQMATASDARLQLNNDQIVRDRKWGARQHNGDAKQLTEISLSLHHVAFPLTYIHQRGETKFGCYSAVLRSSIDFYQNATLLDGKCDLWLFT